MITKGPTILHHILQETIFQDTITKSVNRATDTIAQIVNHNLPSKVSGLALLEITAVLQVLAISGILRIIDEKEPLGYNEQSEVSRLAAIICHQRSLAPSSTWSSVFQWSADDYLARYHTPSEIATRLIEATKEGGSRV